MQHVDPLDLANKFREHVEDLLHTPSMGSNATFHDTHLPLGDKLLSSVNEAEREAAGSTGGTEAERVIVEHRVRRLIGCSARALEDLQSEMRAQSRSSHKDVLQHPDWEPVSRCAALLRTLEGSRRDIPPGSAG